MAPWSSQRQYDLHLYLPHPTPTPHTPLWCSAFIASIPRVLGTEEEGVSMGARRATWWEKEWIDPAAARTAHDTAMACLTAGFLAPWRPKCLRTLKAPQFSTSKCTVQGCKFKDCVGNITYWKDKDRTVLGFRQVLSGGCVWGLLYVG